MQKFFSIITTFISISFLISCSSSFWVRADGSKAADKKDISFCRKTADKSVESNFKSMLDDELQQIEMQHDYKKAYAKCMERKGYVKK